MPSTRKPAVPTPLPPNKYPTSESSPYSRRAPASIAEVTSEVRPSGAVEPCKKPLVQALPGRTPFQASLALAMKPGTRCSDRVVEEAVNAWLTEPLNDRPSYSG